MLSLQLSNPLTTWLRYLRKLRTAAKGVGACLPSNCLWDGTYLTVQYSTYCIYLTYSTHAHPLSSERVSAVRSALNLEPSLNLDHSLAACATSCCGPEAQIRSERRPLQSIASAAPGPRCCASARIVRKRPWPATTIITTTTTRNPRRGGIIKVFLVMICKPS